MRDNVLLTQEIPSQNSCCSYNDDNEDDEEGKDTLAGPRLPSGRSHSLCSSSHLKTKA